MFACLQHDCMRVYEHNIVASPLSLRVSLSRICMLNANGATRAEVRAFGLSAQHNNHNPACNKIM